MSTPLEYKAPTPKEIAEFCETLRERMTEAAECTTLDIKASFGEREVMPYYPHPEFIRHEPDGSWTVTISAGPAR